MESYMKFTIRGFGGNRRHLIVRQCLVVISLSFHNHDGEAFPEKKSPRTFRGLGTSKTVETLKAILSLIFGLKLKCRQIILVLNEKSSQLVIGCY